MFKPSDTQSDISFTSADDINAWHSATGPLNIPMTNDYLFRALLQRNNHVLKGLICSLLHLHLSKVRSVIINNPIILGESINNKTFFLDISITLNDHTLINLEMQVINEHNWPERSLSYLGRTFDNLNSGEDYSAVRPAVQIGLLDFTLFPNHPEFFSTYQFMNTKNYTIYSDTMRLYVLNLTRIDLATKEDKHYHLDYWASLFKATTWEELKMIAKQDEFINEACATVYQLSQEEMIRLQCEAREDFFRRQRSVQHMMENQEKKMENQKKTIENQNMTIENQNMTINELTGAINSMQSEMDSLKTENASLQKQLCDVLKLLNSIQAPPV